MRYCWMFSRSCMNNIVRYNCFSIINSNSYQIFNNIQEPNMHVIFIYIYCIHFGLESQLSPHITSLRYHIKHGNLTMNSCFIVTEQISNYWRLHLFPQLAFSIFDYIPLSHGSNTTNIACWGLLVSTSFRLFFSFDLRHTKKNRIDNDWRPYLRHPWNEPC